MSMTAAISEPLDRDERQDGTAHEVGARFALNSQWKMRIVFPSGKGSSLVLMRGSFSAFSRAFSTSASSDRLIASAM